MPLETGAIGNHVDDERGRGQCFADFLRGSIEAIRTTVFGYHKRECAGLLPQIRVAQLDRGEMLERYRMVELPVQLQVKPNGGVNVGEALRVAQSEHTEAVGANSVVRIAGEAHAEQPLG